MDPDSSLITTETSEDGVQPLVNLVFNGYSNQKRRVSSIMTDLNSFLTESPEQQKKVCLKKLQEILDPDEKDIEVSDSSFTEGCLTLYARYQENLLFSPQNSPVKNVSKVLDFGSPGKCVSPGLSLSDSDLSMSSAPSAELSAELNRLKEECKGLKLQNERLETVRTELIFKLSNIEDKNAELEIYCKELENWKTNRERRASHVHDVTSCEVDMEARESMYNQLRQENKHLKKELAELKKLNSELKDEILDRASLIADKEELQIHAEELHKLREDDRRILEESQSRIQSLEEELHLQTQKNNTLVENIELLQKEIKSFEGYRTAVKYISRQNDELLAMVEHLQESLPAIILCDISDNEEQHSQPMSLKDELGGSLSPLNSSSNSEDSAVMSTSAVEADHPLTPVPAPSVAAPSVAVPSVTAPSVAIPSVPAPSVPAPSVPAPSVPAPSVTEPSVPAPSVTEPVIEETPLVETPHGLSPLCESERSNGDHLSENRLLSISDDRTRDLRESGAENRNTLLGKRNALWHLTSWKKFRIVGGYFLHNFILGYLLVVLVIYLLSPYLDCRLLLKNRPWFVFVGEGSLGPPPV